MYSTASATCVFLLLTFNLYAAGKPCQYATPGSSNVTPPSSVDNSGFALFFTIYKPNPWLLPILHITRLHNPTAKIYAFVRAEAFAQDPQLGQSLADLHVAIRVTEAFNTKDSPLAKLRASGKQLGKDVVNMERFCAYHEAAVEEGITRVMAFDGDIAMFAPALDVIAPYTEDVVSACRFTSQLFIANNVSALGAYCSYMATYFTAHDPEQLAANTELLGWPREKYEHVHDMELMQLFLHHTPSVSRKFLCPEQPNVPICEVRFAGCVLSPQVQAVESLYKVRADQRDYNEPFRACSNLSAFHTIFSWGEDARGVPVPYHTKTGECMPLIHFQGDCKRFVPTFVDHYRERVRQAFASKLDGAGRRRQQRRRRLQPQEESWIQMFLNGASGDPDAGAKKRALR